MAKSDTISTFLSITAIHFWLPKWRPPYGSINDMSEISMPTLCIDEEMLVNWLTTTIRAATTVMVTLLNSIGTDGMVNVMKLMLSSAVTMVCTLTIKLCRKRKYRPQFFDELNSTLKRLSSLTV